MGRYVLWTSPYQSCQPFIPCTCLIAESNPVVTGILDGKYRYMADLLALQTQPHTVIVACEQGPSPILMCLGALNHTFSSYIQSGWRHGF